MNTRGQQRRSRKFFEGGSSSPLSLPVSKATRVINLHTSFHPTSAEKPGEFIQFLAAWEQAQCLQQESKPEAISPPKAPSRKGEAAKRAVDSERQDRWLTAASRINEGMQPLMAEALKGDSEAIRNRAQQAMAATLVLQLAEFAHPVPIREAARKQVAWPVLARHEKGWEVDAAQRVAGLDVGGGFPMFRVKFRPAQGPDENYPARVWAKAAVRTLEETRFRFAAFGESQVGFTALIENQGWDLAPPPEWAELAAILPLFARDTVPKWAEVIRKLIRDLVKDFRLCPEWKTQCNTARQSGRDTVGEIQNAILDDIISAFQRLAPIKEMPKSAR
jgi:hypothetical protein